MQGSACFLTPLPQPLEGWPALFCGMRIRLGLTTVVMGGWAPLNVALFGVGGADELAWTGFTCRTLAAGRAWQKELVTKNSFERKQLFPFLCSPSGGFGRSMAQTNGKMARWPQFHYSHRRFLSRVFFTLWWECRATALCLTLMAGSRLPNFIDSAVSV